MSVSSNLDPPYILLQALIETSLDLVKLLSLRSCGSWVATKHLGLSSDALDALARLELGSENYIVSPGPQGGRLVLLKSCPFATVFGKIDPWSEEAMLLVQRFNESPRGGAALHPICIPHLSVRESYKAVNLGCRSATSGKIAVSVQTLLEEAGLSEEEVGEKLEGHACLYWLK